MYVNVLFLYSNNIIICSYISSRGYSFTNKHNTVMFIGIFDEGI